MGLMPSITVLRNFVENGYYHVFNRGVEKRNIFIDEQDYQVFSYYLFIYLHPLDKVLLKYPELPVRLYPRNLNSEVRLLAYCLMPNHFHLLLTQSSLDGISKLLKQLTNAYAFYFNKKYKRVGALLQGRFKAVTIETDNQLVHVSRYIHLNPLIAGLNQNLRDYPWSSYSTYLNSHETFCDSSQILSFFPSAKEYENFVLDQIDFAKELNIIKHLTLDD